MDAYSDPHIHHIVVVASSQVGKSEFENNVIGRTIDVDPGSILFIHPVQGIFTAGTGLAALGAGFLLLALCLLFYGRLIPRLICRIIDWISGMLHKGRSQR